MRFRATKHRSHSGVHHGRPVPHGQFIGQPHRKGTKHMDAINVPFGLDTHPMGSATPIGGADVEPDAGSSGEPAEGE